MEEKLKEYKTTHKRCADCAFSRQGLMVQNKLLFLGANFLIKPL